MHFVGYLYKDYHNARSLEHKVHCEDNKTEVPLMSLLCDHPINIPFAIVQDLDTLKVVLSQ
jgi:hypothetical protein